MSTTTISYRIYCKICNSYIKTISLGDNLSPEDAMLLRGSVCASCRNAMFKKLWK
ncbi:MAG: hypothetical protein ABS949_17735 [Solibacillus sp.]